MGKLYTSSKPRLILPSDIAEEIIQQPSIEPEEHPLYEAAVAKIAAFYYEESVKELEKNSPEKVVYINCPVEIEKIIYVDRPIETIVERIIEVPVVEKQTEYITITKIETVEVPVIKEVERIVTVHDIEATLQEKKRVVALEQKVSRYQIVVAALMVLTVILGAV